MKHRLIIFLLMLLLLLVAAIAYQLPSPVDIDATPPAIPATDLPVKPGTVPMPAYTRLSLIFAGDVMLDRGVESSIRQHGPDAVFAGVKNIIQNADLAFCNLESPLSLTGNLRPKEVNFQAESLLSLTLGAAGFDAVSLANNHISDYSAAGLNETLTALDVSGIGYCGAGNNLTEALRPWVTERRGIKIAVVSFCKAFWSVDVATSNQPGIAQADTEVIIHSLELAREQADVVIASFHWDWEYNSRPCEESIGWAQLAAENGANMIVGHHPHVLQGIEMMGDVPVAYSLGNFVFDQKQLPRRETALLEVELLVEKSGETTVVEPLSLKVIPLIIDPVTCFPQRPTAEAKAQIAERFATLSNRLGTETTVDDDNNVVITTGSRK